jgi:hypothetical protein
MSKTRIKEWNAIQKELYALYAIENTMTVSEFLKLLKPLREKQDKIRD